MTEAVVSSMEYVFNNLNIDNIIYSYAEENFKSKGLSDKIGFNFYSSETVHYKRIDKDIKEIKMIISKEEFNKIYNYKSRCKNGNI